MCVYMLSFILSATISFAFYGYTYRISSIKCLDYVYVKGEYQSNM